MLPTGISVILFTTMTANPNTCETNQIVDIVKSEHPDVFHYAAMYITPPSPLTGYACDFASDFYYQTV